MARLKKQTNGTAANIGYEAELWQMADALRGSMDAGKYKHVVLGLLFLKYISDAFEEKMLRLATTLEQQFAESTRLEKAIRENLRGLGYGG